MTATRLTSAGAGADFDAGKRRVARAVTQAASLFFPDYFVCGQVEGGGARMPECDPRARSDVHSSSRLVEAWPGSASPS
jgi:hypothetical protein